MSKGLGDLMKQAQKLQARMMTLQEELAGKTVEATSGGGMVSVVVNGKQEIVSLKIDPEVVDRQEIEMLQDLVIAAVNDGIR
jgi:DNA-binding YbaB/EbfC family protein